MKNQQKVSGVQWGVAFIKILLVVAVVIVVTAGVGIVYTNTAQAVPCSTDRTPTSADVTPSSIVLNQSTTLTFTAPISKPCLIPNSVNLIQLNANMKSIAILGLLNDQGLGGDLVAGDQVYTIEKTLTPGSTEPLFFQMTYAIYGQLLRHKTVVLTVSVTP